MKEERRGFRKWRRGDPCHREAKLSPVVTQKLESVPNNMNNHVRVWGCHLASFRAGVQQKTPASRRAAMHQGAGNEATSHPRSLCGKQG